MAYSITELKNSLGSGLGLRKNRYLIEIPMPNIDGRTLNILCQSAGFPERNINTTELWHKGRKYSLRGETDFGGEYEITVLDDSNMQIRRLFDIWIKQVDNSRPNPNSGILGASFEDYGNIVNEIQQGVAAANQLANAAKDPKDILNFAAGLLDTNKGVSNASYQTDINIWQLDSKNKKVYGYKIQNAFPKNIGALTFSDSEENSLSEFNITFSFSEFVPLRDSKREIIGSVFGDGISDLF